MKLKLFPGTARLLREIKNYRWTPKKSAPATKASIEELDLVAAVLVAKREPGGLRGRWPRTRRKSGARERR